MGVVFNLNSNGNIVVANQNTFFTPIKHPSRTLDEHVISYVIKGSWKLDIGGEIVTATNDNLFIQPGNIPHIGTNGVLRGIFFCFKILFIPRQKVRHAHISPTKNCRRFPKQTGPTHSPASAAENTQAQRKK